MLAENSRGFDRSLLQLVKDSCNELCLFGTRATFLVMVSMWKVSQPSVRHFLMDGKDPRMESEEAWHGVRFFPLSGRNAAGFVTNPTLSRLHLPVIFGKTTDLFLGCFGTSPQRGKAFWGLRHLDDYAATFLEVPLEACGVPLAGAEAIILWGASEKYMFSSFKTIHQCRWAKMELGIFLMLDFNTSITNHLSAAMFRKVCCWLLIPFWRLVRQDCGGVSAAEAASQLVRTILNSNLPDWHGFSLCCHVKRTKSHVMDHCWWPVKSGACYVWKS